MFATRDALLEYFYNTSKPLLARGTANPKIMEIHGCVFPLYEQFKQDIILL